MLYRFIERNDGGAVSIAIANVTRNKIIWEGEKVKTMKELLANTSWSQLGGNSFDEKNPEHWKRLPELITGSRLWVETG